MSSIEFADKTERKRFILELPKNNKGHSKYSLEEQEAVFGPKRQVLIAGDVRLFNRANIAEQYKNIQCDRALVAALWEEMGGKAVELLTGIFAFAVLELEFDRIYLARDRVGGRSIYYSTAGDIIRVSNDPAYISSRLSHKTIDPIALRDYLSCAFVPGYRTMIEEINELRPGSIMELPHGRSFHYWKIEEKLAAVEPSLAQSAAELRMLLEEVMSEYLPEGPVGSYLSGGIDSSLVTAIARSLHKKSEVHTFSIHFGPSLPNELQFSSLAAQHCNTQHHQVEVSEKQMWGMLPECMQLLDDPIGDPLTIPNLILGRTAKQYTSTILNGEGGDPCFGGPKNQPMLLSQLYAVEQAAPSHVSSTAKPLRFPSKEGSEVTSNLVADYMASFQKCSSDLNILLKPDLLKACLKEPSVFSHDLKAKTSFLNRLMFINTKYKGADHILTKVNNLTSSCGIVGLSPLFDQRIVDYSLTVPPKYKLQGAEEKAILKAAVADLLPAAILTRPKSGMMVPVQYWFRERWNKEAKALLLSKNCILLHYLDRKIIEQWLNYEGDAWARYGVKLWLLVSLEYWLRARF